METKECMILGEKVELLKYKEEWVFPIVSYYTDELGAPVAMTLEVFKEGELEPYSTVTVNLPQCKRGAGCQFIDTNNNGENILDWLEKNDFGKRTGNFGKSGFCSYPEFDFYSGDTFWKYKDLYEKLMIKQRTV